MENSKAKFQKNETFYLNTSNDWIAMNTISQSRIYKYDIMERAERKFLPISKSNHSNRNMNHETENSKQVVLSEFWGITEQWSSSAKRLSQPRKMLDQALCSQNSF